MSDKTFSAGGKFRSARSEMNITADNDAEALREACEWLEKLTLAEFRGRGDTVGAARARVAKQIGVKTSYANRLWNRVSEMTGIAGGTYRALQRAYDAQCERNEAMAAYHRQRREELADGGPTDPQRMAEIHGVAGLPQQQSAPSPH